MSESNEGGAFEVGTSTKLASVVSSRPDAPDIWEGGAPSTVPAFEAAAHHLLSRLEHVTPLEPPTEEAAEGFADISLAHIEVPVLATQSSRWVLPPWLREGLWYAGVGTLSVAILVTAYVSALRAPVPMTEIDPSLEVRRARIHQAKQALERGHRLARQGDGSLQGAIAAYQEALAVEPELAAAERGLAIVYTQQGHKVKAARHYRRYLHLDPKSPDAAAVKAILTRWRTDWAR